MQCTYNDDIGFSSAAYGSNKYARVKIPGRISLDLMIYIKREYPNLESYNLNDIATHFIGAQKDPVSVLQMFTAYANQDPVLSRVVAEYCVQDTVLPQLIIDKLNVLLSLDTMAGVTCVTIPDLIEKGQGVKTFSQLNRKTMAEGFLIPDETGSSATSTRARPSLRPCRASTLTP